MLLVLVGLAGYLADFLGPDVRDSLRDWVIRGLGGFLAPDTTDEFVRPWIDGFFEGRRGGVVSISAGVAIWSASRFVRVLIETMNIAYDVDEWRPAWRRRLLSVVLTAGGLFLLAVFLPSVIAGPQLGRAIDERFGLGGVLGVAWSIVYWPATVALGVSLLASLYHIAPSRWTPWRRDLPGAVLATAGWLVAAVGLRVYVGFAVSERDLGPLAAPVVLLLWFYASAFVVLLGGEVNAEIEKMWPAGRGGRKRTTDRATASASEVTGEIEP